MPTTVTRRRLREFGPLADDASDKRPKCSVCGEQIPPEERFALSSDDPGGPMCGTCHESLIVAAKEKLAAGQPARRESQFAARLRGTPARRKFTESESKSFADKLRDPLFK